VLDELDAVPRLLLIVLQAWLLHDRPFRKLKLNVFGLAVFGVGSFIRVFRAVTSQIALLQSFRREDPSLG